VRRRVLEAAAWAMFAAALGIAWASMLGVRL
jgi:hypothetical protein